MPGAVALLETLTKGARTAYPFIKAGVAAGQTAKEIIQALQEGGMGARRADVLAIIRAETNSLLTQSDLQHYLRNVPVPLERVPEAVTKIIAPFSYRVEMRYFDEVTGETVTLNRTAHSQELMSFDEVAASLARDKGEAYGAEGMTLVDANVVGVVRSGAAGVI